MNEWTQNAKTIEEICTLQKEYFRSGVTFSVEYRLNLLRTLKKTIKEYEPEIQRAIKKDIGKAEAESYMCEVGLTMSEISYIEHHLKSWAKTRKVRTTLGNFPSVSRIVQEPYGSVLIMSPWNYPFLLAMEPLAGAIAAGNTVVLKPSNYSPETSRMIRIIAERVFDPGQVSVVLGGREENQALLEQKFDYIFFTGSVKVGKLVMEKASRHLTPVSLELGGKSPCIVDHTANLKLAAKRIAYGKYLNCGQTCIAPDYLLIEKSVKEKFLSYYRQAVKKMFGEQPLDNPDYGKIVNRKHFDRLCALMDQKKIILGGELQPDKLQIAPTVMDDVTGEDAIMQEEIFGPILPVITVADMQEAEQFVLKRPKPLALYLFTGDSAAEKRFMKQIPFGGGCINDTIAHLVSEEMAFGGVGNSGMGSYHGKKSFETFSHAKGVLKKSTLIDTPMRYQPYNEIYGKIIHLILR